MHQEHHFASRPSWRLIKKLNEQLISTYLVFITSLSTFSACLSSIPHKHRMFQPNYARKIPRRRPRPHFLGISFPPVSAAPALSPLRPALRSHSVPSGIPDSGSPRLLPRYCPDGLSRLQPKEERKAKIHAVLRIFRDPDKVNKRLSPDVEAYIDLSRHCCIAIVVDHLT